MKEHNFYSKFFMSDTDKQGHLLILIDLKRGYQIFWKLE